MKSLSIFFYEWKHFTRSPFKIMTLLLFVIAGVYGLHNGAGLYHQQISEIEKIKENITKERQKYISYYDEGKKGPEDRPWIDINTPFWAIWNSSIYHFKTPSPALVYSIGQAEQYGFYKRVTFWSSPYDADMTQEIANPERLQTGTLDFAFAGLYLLPLLLLILLYNLKTAEAEQNFLPLIEVQTSSGNTWLLSRVSFYVSLVLGVTIVMILYGAMLTDVFATASTAFGQMLLYSLLYLVFWSFIYFFILKNSNNIMSATLQMVGVWLLFAFIIPATIHQWISISMPAHLMTEWIDAQRDESEQLFQQPDSVTMTQLSALFPEIESSTAIQDSTKSYSAMNNSASALVNELVKKSIAPIEASNQAKNDLIQSAFLLSPISFFQNHLNRISQTHYDDYQNYRHEIQTIIDKQIRTMVLETWNEVTVDKAKYEAYIKL